MSCNECADDFPTFTETEVIDLDDTAEITIASDIGSYSCCEAWFSVPEDWIPRVTLRLYGRVLKARVLLAQVALADAVVTGEIGQNQCGIAMSIRGRPCSSFELSCQASEGDDLTGGRFYLQSWHSPATPGGSAESATVGGSKVVSAVLVARDADTGELREVSMDVGGRVRTVRSPPPA